MRWNWGGYFADLNAITSVYLGWEIGFLAKLFHDVASDGRFVRSGESVPF